MTALKIPLGHLATGMAQKVSSNETTIEQRIRQLEKRLYEMELKFQQSNRSGTNKNGIPYGTLFIGRTKGRQYFLVCSPDGFRVGNHTYKSLSAAAKAVSGVRRSGWTFWQLPDGKSAKEVYGKK